MTNFLNMLVQREQGQADNAIVPRLPSRYEPTEQKGSLPAFDKSESRAVNLEANLADERRTDTREQAWQDSDTNPSDTRPSETLSKSGETRDQLAAQHGRKPESLESPAVPEHDNAKPEHRTATIPPAPGLTPVGRDQTTVAVERARSVGWVERSATHHGGDGLRPASSTHPTLTGELDHAGIDNKHHEHEQPGSLETLLPTQSTTGPRKEFGQDKHKPITTSKGATISAHAQTGDITALAESTPKHIQPAQREPVQRESLSSSKGEEEARATEPGKAAKRQSISSRSHPTDNLQDINRIPAHQEDQQTSRTRAGSLSPIAESVTGTVPEPITGKIEYGAQGHVTSHVAATQTKGSAGDPEVASQNHSSAPGASANAAMEAVSVKPEPVASRQDKHSPAPSRGEDNAAYNERDNLTLPISREAIPARVTVRKASDTVPALSSGILPRSSPHQDAQEQAPVPLPTINVTIGRIEVRAVTPPATPKRSNAGPRPMSLSEYLSQHSGGNNRRGSQ